MKSYIKSITKMLIGHILNGKFLNARTESAEWSNYGIELNMWGREKVVQTFPISLIQNLCYGKYDVLDEMDADQMVNEMITRFVAFRYKFECVDGDRIEIYTFEQVKEGMILLTVNGDKIYICWNMLESMRNLVKDHIKKLVSYFLNDHTITYFDEWIGTYVMKVRADHYGPDDE